MQTLQCIHTGPRSEKSDINCADWEEELVDGANCVLDMEAVRMIMHFATELEGEFLDIADSMRLAEKAAWVRVFCPFLGCLWPSTICPSVPF